MNKNEQNYVSTEEALLSEFSEAEEVLLEDKNDAIGAFPEEVGEDLPEDDGNITAKNDELRKSEEKEEYRRLIKTRFKDSYQEDAQKLINRRFRKYKELEEKYGESEKRLNEAISELSSLKESFQSEIEKAIKETEEKVLNSVRQRRLRPAENGMVPSVAFGKSEVSALTKSERANIAKRAANGEKISF